MEPSDNVFVLLHHSHKVFIKNSLKSQYYCIDGG